MATRSLGTVPANYLFLELHYWRCQQHSNVRPHCSGAPFVHCVAAGYWYGCVFACAQCAQVVVLLDTQQSHAVHLRFWFRHDDTAGWFFLLFLAHLHSRSLCLALAHQLVQFANLLSLQLFINYKLKSVAHLPWRAMVYKALNSECCSCAVWFLFCLALTRPTFSLRPFLDESVH